MKLFNLFKPNVFWFYLKQWFQLKKNMGRLKLKSYRLTYEELVKITIEDNGNISFGDKIHIRKGVDIEARDNANINIGDNFFINKNSSIIARYGIDIGNNCMIGENTTIVDHNHTFGNSSLPFKDQGYNGSKITIGDNVWIAGRVFIGHGVCIGDNVVIGSNTIITKSIPSDSIVYGKIDLVIKPLHSGGIA